MNYNFLFILQISKIQGEKFCFEKNGFPQGQRPKPYFSMKEGEKKQKDFFRRPFFFSFHVLNILLLTEYMYVLNITV